MDRVFLDANVLFSAAYDSAARIARLFSLKEVELISSAYAVAEATVNILQKKPRRSRALARLVRRLDLVLPRSFAPLPAGVELPADDRPILQAAIAARASVLLTGDRDFRALYGRVIEGVLVMRPGDYLRLKAKES